MDRRKPLGLYLIRIFFLGIFPALLIFCTVASVIGYGIINHQISDKSRLLTKVLTQSFESFQSNTSRALGFIGNNLQQDNSLARGLYNPINLLLQTALSSYEYFNAILVLDKKGTVLVSVHSDFDLPGIDYSLQSFSNAEKDKFNWSLLSKSPETKKNSLALSVQVGEYVLVAILDLTPLEKIFDATLDPGSEMLILTDKTGLVIARNHSKKASANAVDRDHFAWMPKQVDQEFFETQRVSNSEGLLEVQTFSLGVSKVLMHLVRDQNVLFQGLRTYLAAIGLVFLILVVIVSGLVFPLFRLMSDQLKDIVLAITSISDGRQGKIALAGEIEEFYQLGAQVNRMLATLHSREGRILELNLSLESKVRARTGELEDKNKELSEALINLKSTQDQLLLSEKMATVGQLVAGVAHEISTPVGVGLTAATYLESKVQTVNKAFVAGALSKKDFEAFIQTVKESSHIVARNLERASDLIGSFKQVAVDHSTDDLRTFDVKAYCEEVVRNIRPALKHRPIEVQVLIEDGIRIMSFPGGFSHILTNLIMNSLIHGYDPQQAGIIKISASMDDDYFTLIYCDDGKGITPAIKDKVFEPFFTTRRNEGSSGLGMHIVHNIVSNQLKGSLDLQSALDHGMTVTITIPAHECRVSSNREKL